MNCSRCKDTGKLSGIFLDCHYCGLADEYAAVVKWAKEGGMDGSDEESLIALYEHGKQQAEPLLARIAELEREVAANREKIAAAVESDLAAHRKLAGESLRADQGWQRYEEKNRECNALRDQIATTKENSHD